MTQGPIPDIDTLHREQAILNRVYRSSTNSLATSGSDVNYVLFDPDDSAPTYIGINESADALTSSTDWTVYKFLYSGSNTTSIRKKTGSWDNRASLF